MAIKVLSLFDGISCGQLALKKLGIEVSEYYASEIDKQAIAITQKNFPDTIQLGDVKDIKAVDMAEIDLILAGSPCQGFSLSGLQKGLEDKRSGLFLEFLRLRDEVKPRHWFLENVKMRKDYLEKLSSMVGVEAFNINSNLFSAQSRDRYYWANWQLNEPTSCNNDRIKDILASGLEYSDDNSYYWYDLDSQGKTGIMTVGGIVKRGTKTRAENPQSVSDFSSNQRVYDINGKSPSLLTGYSYWVTDHHYSRPLTIVELERLQGLPDNYTEGTSRRQRIRAIGNGWNVPTIEYLLSPLKHTL